MIIKNIEARIRLAFFISAGSLLTSLLIVGINSYYAYHLVSNAHKSIYILDKSVPILAKQTDMQMNRPAEYRAHIDLFHSFFFSLTPDDHYMEYQMKKAMYLIDESGMQQYNDLKEKVSLTLSSPRVPYSPLKQIPLRWICPGVISGTMAN